MFNSAVNMTINSAYHHTPQQLNEEFVIIEAAKLNPERFDVLYNKYYKQIFNFVYQRLDCKDTAFDLTGQVFLKAMLHLQTYEFKGVPFASWLYRIAQNELLQLFRHVKNKHAINADVGDLRFICEETEEPFFEEYLPAIKKLITLLNEDDLQMVELRFFEKRPFKEIAELLDITESNAKVKMHRVIEKLRIEIKKLKL